MSGKRAKRLRREAKERGDYPTKRLFYPVTFMLPTGRTDFKTGEPIREETYIPRRQRRKMIRQFMTGVRKGRINLNDRNQQG